MRLGETFNQLRGEQVMFGMKTKKQKLETKLAKLREESYLLSHKNRTKSDEKAAEADLVLKQIEEIERQNLK